MNACSVEALTARADKAHNRRLQQEEWIAFADERLEKLKAAGDEGIRILAQSGKFRYADVSKGEDTNNPRELSS